MQFAGLMYYTCSVYNLGGDGTWIRPTCNNLTGGLWIHIDCVKQKYVYMAGVAAATVMYSTCQQLPRYQWVLFP